MASADCSAHILFFLNKGNSSSLFSFLPMFVIEKGSKLKGAGNADKDQVSESLLGGISGKFFEMLPIE